MKTPLTILAAMLATNLYAQQGCVIGSQPSNPRYVCFDGRTLAASASGLVWNSKRGCFVSAVPCCNYNATHYAFDANSSKIGSAYARCRHDYPFRLGEMQTH